MIKDESSVLCLFFCLVTQKYNVISYDCCCLPPHIVFIHVLAIVHFPFYKYTSPLFHILICHISEAWSKHWLIFCATSSSDWRHPFGILHYPLIATSHLLLEKILWLGFFLPPVSWQGPDLLVQVTEHDSELKYKEERKWNWEQLMTMFYRAMCSMFMHPESLILCTLTSSVTVSGGDLCVGN